MGWMLAAAVKRGIHGTCTDLPAPVTSRAL